MFWLPELHDAVVTVDAISADADHPDALDIRSAGVEALLLCVSGQGEQLLLRQGSRAIRLNVRSGTVDQGPVRLRYALAGMARLEPQLLTLRRLVGLWRLGRMPADLFPSERRAPRWIELLRTLDALAAGASQREIAAALFGFETVERDWRGRSDYLRLRVQRLTATGRALVRGGYRFLLRGSNSR
ncbi:DUF2285 domain-containing protein [Sphingomonas koreensis]|uniref:DUF2285 domain-containing protein n=1 Tax=Sphingomonas koreensis TaxID=93064 RepID=A0AAJ4S2Y5_9SPHN|nr:DUF2285 domain-containing protein [Sphingomonas koreensis]MDC7810539.1 DUF2285 domain-containing protein [Sphingomonas koreensis]RSU17096.1 DUF2285 domain-containing protein [Sphingomonas koreensis]RSU20058.1 DUF2285 domain-containing protein [Sphingomonas koreensis]RSU22012.1 DUF2285 domain-containing protein [Sphingomonas koreensis]RSU31727.1 DUF2285 domain-containing protein [Sphingomonas koreensis]